MMRRVLVVFLLCLCTSRGSFGRSESYYRPLSETYTHRRFNVGASGLFVTIQKGLVTTVDGTEPGSPADGKFAKGDVLLAVNGSTLEAEDLRTALGETIRRAFPLGDAGTV